MPAAVAHEQVLVLLEAQQGPGFASTVLDLAEEARVLALQLGELGRKHLDHAGVVAELLTEAGGNAQVLVRGVVEQFVSGHLGSLHFLQPAPSIPGCIAPAGGTDPGYGVAAAASAPR